MLRNKLLFISIIGLALYLRLFQFGSNPPSLYWEEVALGYDAYSLLKTGADHHGNVLPIIALESFGDWKPALYAYLIIPFITLFDLSAVAVRLPSLLAGVSILFAIYLLAKELGQKPLIAMSIAAVAPWAIHFSRAGWESHVSAALILWGLYCGIRCVGKNIRLRRAMACIILLAASLYTYHAARITTPLLGISLLVYTLFKVHNNKGGIKAFLQVNKFKLLALTTVLFALLVPFLQNLDSPALLQRGKETSIFTDIAVIEESNRLRENSNYSLVSRILYHRYVLFGKEIARNYASHINLDFLFISGDSQPRHSSQFFGHLYHIEFLFLIFGVVSWYRKRSPEILLVALWLLLSIIPGSITHASPHALRMLAGFPVFALLIASGIEYLYEQYKEWLKASYKILLPAFLLIVVGLYSVELAAFWRHYTKIYPVEYASEWQYGYAEMIKSLEESMGENPDLPVYVSREMGRPAMYYWFFTKTDPRLVQAANDTAKKDQGEFLEFGSVEFARGLDSRAKVQGAGIYAYLENQKWFVVQNEI